MFLHLNPFKSATTTDERHSPSRPLVFGQYYTLSDAEGYRAIFQKLGDNTVVVEITQGEKRVQYGSVPRLSFIAGRKPSGTARVLPYSIEIHPDKPVFPVRQLAETLIERGVRGRQITPMFDRTLSDCIESHLKSMMLSDGVVDSLSLPAEGDLMTAKTEFKVRDASWAILAAGSEIFQVYVWMNAAEPENAAALLEKLQQIQTGKFMSA